MKIDWHDFKFKFWATILAIKVWESYWYDQLLSYTSTTKRFTLGKFNLSIYVKYHSLYIYIYIIEREKIYYSLYLLQ